MANLRSVNTKFWEDPWVESLNVSDKLLFLYLITNSYANLAGIYEITIKRISFETGLNQESIRKGLKGFETVKKAYFVLDNYMFLPNWLKNQNLNTNMKKGVMTIIKQLPKDVKINILGNDYQTLSKDYETVRNTLLKYEVEVEVEVLEDELEVEIEEKDVKIKYAEFVSLTKSEYDKLITDYGKVNVDKMILTLDNYKGSSGKKYKSDYRAILSWVVEKAGCFKSIEQQKKLPKWECRFNAGPTEIYEVETEDQAKQCYFNHYGAYPHSIESK